MKIVLYSTNSNHFDENTYFIKNIPSWNEQKLAFQKNYPEYELIFVTQKPSLFLADINETENLNTYFVETKDSDEFAAKIAGFNPDLVIAASFWVTPYDWLPVKDAIIAEKLRGMGFKTICHSVEATAICFDKNKTHDFLEKHNFNIAKAVYVDHDLFFCAGSKKEVIDNVYKEYVLNQIKKLNFPLIIKDTVGLSSYGMEVVHTFGEAKNYLNSKKNNSDRIVEELINGEHFGLEIYGTKDNYFVMPPFSFSLNQYGITSPKLSKKTGPVLDSKYKLDELNNEMLRLAEALELNGIAQVDLVFSEDKWYIIEINPRMSGMTTTYAAAMGKSVYELIKDFLITPPPSGFTPKLHKTCNEKTPVKTAEEIEELKKIPGIVQICQVEDKSAKQLREIGYCEVIYIAQY